MKAILVIDIPNDIDISKVRIGGDGNIYYIRDGERASIVGNIRNIKPLPIKKMPKQGEAFPQDMRLIDRWRGWDACIDEIMGETE